MSVPTTLQYTETHEWVKKEGACYLCGITDYAQKELSDIVFVELPPIGKHVKKGETLCVVESVKAASDIYAPISGTVKEVNGVLSQSPEKVNADPYGSWLCKLEPSNPAELSSLLAAAGYTAHIGG